MKDLLDLDPVWLMTLAEIVETADKQAKANRGR